MTRPASLLVGVAVAVVTIAGCTADRTPTAQPLPTLGPTTSSTLPAVPGGAPIIVPSDAPPICAKVAASQAVRDIPGSMRALAEPETAVKGTAGLRDAAADMRVIAADAGAPLAATLVRAARDLDQLAETGLQNLTAVTAVVDDLTTLGREVQNTCHFPVSS